MDALLTGDAERSSPTSPTRISTRRGGKLGGRHGVTGPREAAADQHGGAAAERRRRRAEHVHGAHHGDTAKDAKTLAWLIACGASGSTFSTLSVAQQEAMVGRMFKENVAENGLIQLGDETAEYAAQFRAIF